LVPTLILDVTEEEADKLLMTLDPLVSMAESNAERIRGLLQTVQTNSPAVEALLRRTAGDQLWELIHPRSTRNLPHKSIRLASYKRSGAPKPVSSGELMDIACSAAIQLMLRTLCD
jgi:hypothetical protein